MLLLALDLETTGLDPLQHQILEIGMVATDLTDLQRRRHEFRRLVSHSSYQGDPYALAMNHKILSEIADAGKNKAGLDVIVTLEELVGEVLLWLSNLPYKGKFTFSGKNVGTFDLGFMRMVPGWKEFEKEISSYRVFDVAPLYFRPSDPKMPSLKECLERAGLHRIVVHQALQDAHDCLDLIHSHSYKAMNLKRGTWYDVLSRDVMNSTNGSVNGDRMVLYRAEDGHLYVRTLEEFDEKFTNG